MPRNCGCSGGCSCVIKQGSGALVTGSGRAPDPYVISLAGGGGGGGGFDPGDLKWTARNSAPVGWLVCDGAAVSRTTYDDLFAAIGTLYGAGDGATTFNLPDYTGRFMLGADGSHVQGSTGGAEQRTLTGSNLPAHTHSIGHDHPAGTTSSSGVHEHGAHSNDEDGVNTSIYRTGAQAGNALSGDLINTAGAHTHTFDVPAYTGDSGSAGGGQPFSTMPPYGTALPLIKT